MDARARAHEQVLVIRCQAGDRDAFACLFERYQGPLKYYLRRLIASPQTADDVLQTVWLKVLPGIGKLQRPDLFRPWLYRVARNEAFQQLRRQKRWDNIREPGPVPEPADEIEDDFTEADVARVHAALGQLSVAHRDVLVLRFIEDLSYREMASIIGCDLGTIRSRLHHAKRALRRVLEESNDDD